mgnify:CR=1 FL=1|jgi:CRISPR-associated protein Cas2
MYVILVYDIKEKRVGKVLKKMREYLYWIQNSVFEGEITEATYKKMLIELGSIIDEDEDSVIVYKLRTTRYLEKYVIGQEKGGETNFL